MPDSFRRGWPLMFRHSAMIGVFMLLSGFSWPQRLQQYTQEYQLKAVFLFNFAQFIEWQKDAFAETGEPLIIGVLGKDPFGIFLDETVKGEAIEGHPMEVKRYDHVEDVDRCHILFINIESPTELQRALGKLKGRNILTVGDSDSFIRQGGMVRFVEKDNKMRFQINLEVARTSGLTVSSKLLRLAEIVTN